jgi:hypothetical protein
MHINITNSEMGNNKGSSGALVSYLEKENKQVQNLNREPEYWFNYQGQDIQPYEVRYNLDKNIAKLMKDEAKFFLINISPSENELRYLIEEYGKEEARQQLKAYANKVMDDYAKNFKKERIKGNDDLLYYGKVENHRYYTHRDEEVKNGLAKRGERKPGENMHVQIIVSRKDISNTIRLSPMNNSRGKNQAHSLKVGQFDRSAFKQIAEKQFDQAFGYDRGLKETFKYANTLKHGDYEQRQDLAAELRKEQEQKQQENLQQERECQQQLERKQSHRLDQGLTPGGW